MPKFYRSLCGFLFVIISALYAQGIVFAGGPAPYIPHMPTKPEDTKVYLLTAFRGEQIYATGGHSALRVIDAEHQLDGVFNWGTFDFEDKDFIIKFMRGNIKYKMVAYPSRLHTQMYQSEKRKLVQQEILLTPEQKRRFFVSLIEASQPENTLFRYHYYFTNCVTKIIDRLDDALMGQLKPHMSGQMTTHTLRSAVRESFNYFPTVSSLLEIVMNKDLDFVMNEEQDSFLPVRFKPHLESVPQFDDASGKFIEGSSILGPEEVLVDFPEPKTYWWQTSLWIGMFLAICVMVLMLVWRSSPNRLTTYKWLFLPQIGLWFFSTLVSNVMLLIWFATDHEHGRQSASLFVFWPLDILLAYGAFALLRAKDGTEKNLSHTIISWYAFLKACSLILVGLAWSLGFVEQDLSRVLLHWGVPALLSSALIGSMLRTIPSKER